VLDTRHCINSTSKTYDGDQWVRAELIVLGDSLITHIINGDTVMQYSKPQIGGGVVENYDPKIKQDGKILSSGFIALQSEGQPIDFRKVEIKELK
jgi:N-acetylglucosamine-6-phosphate deacetylase